MAPGNQAETAFPVCGTTSATRSSGLLAKRAASGRMVVDRMAHNEQPTQYWLATLPADTKLKELVKLAKHRWIIERDYQELKQELGLGHYEGRGWRGFHHHATLCIAAYGFLVAERSRFPPHATSVDWTYAPPKNSVPVSSPGLAASAPSVITRTPSQHYEFRWAGILPGIFPAAHCVAADAYDYL